jgi:hypothetical protein
VAAWLLWDRRAPGLRAGSPVARAVLGSAGPGCFRPWVLVIHWLNAGCGWTFGHDVSESPTRATSGGVQGGPAACEDLAVPGGRAGGASRQWMQSCRRWKRGSLLS